LSRHLVKEAFESKADVDRPMTAKGAAGRRVGEHATAGVLDIVKVVDRVKHRAGIEDRHDAISRVRAAALVAIAFDRGYPSILVHANLQANVGLGPTAMGNESLLARRYDAHGSVGFTREQRGDQLDVERLGATTETAADMWLDYADARHIHVEDL